VEALHQQHERVGLFSRPLLGAQQLLVLLVAVAQQLHFLVETSERVVFPFDPFFLLKRNPPWARSVAAGTGQRAQGGAPRRAYGRGTCQCRSMSPSVRAELENPANSQCTLRCRVLRFLPNSCTGATGFDASTVCPVRW